MDDLSAIRHFTSVDIELANSDLHSICEIGIARFRAGNLVETWRAVINPECDFEAIYHSNLHGIRQEHAQDAPTFPAIYGTLERFLDGENCIYHAASNFDPNCISSACRRYLLEDVTDGATWRSTLDLARQCWPGESSYKLENLCKKIRHSYLPHNALEDSIACGALFRALSGCAVVPAIQAAGDASDRPRTFRKVASQRRGTGLKANEDGPFAATFVVYSGVFSPPWDDRPQFEELLCSLGFCPRNNFSKKTKLLVVGEGAGPRKIEYAQENGILIMDEWEFFEMVRRETGETYLLNQCIIPDAP